jgi:hypothetical protein
MIASIANTRLLASELSKAIAALEQEAENYRDGDKYQPRGKALHRLAKKAREALTKAGAR